MTSNNEPVRPDDETEPAAARSASDSADRVGYGHPPRHSRFRPGQSGNPTGRPKGRRSFRRDITAALDASRVEGGKTNQQTLAEALVNDALAGNPVALKIVAPIALALDDEGKDREEEVTALQQKLIDDFNQDRKSVV